jgi:hypothetical protein
MTLAAYLIDLAGLVPDPGTTATAFLPDDGAWAMLDFYIDGIFVWTEFVKLPTPEVRETARRVRRGEAAVRRSA